MPKIDKVREGLVGGIPLQGLVGSFLLRHVVIQDCGSFMLCVQCYGDGIPRVISRVTILITHIRGLTNLQVRGSSSRV